MNNNYYDKMHRFGRIMTAISLVVFFGVPLVVSLYYDIMPSVSEILAASGGLMAIFLPAAIAEMVSQTPVLGTTYYLSCITGNVTNLKLPAALNSLAVVNVKKGTPEADAVAGIAVAASSITTMLVIALGVLLLVPLQPVLQSEVVTTATSYILPALFGCLSLSILNNKAGDGKIIKGYYKPMILPIIIAVVLCLLIPSLYSLFQGAIVILCIPLLYFITKHLYKKGQISIVEKEDK